MQSGKYCYPGNHQMQTCPLDFLSEKHDSLLQRTRIHCSRVQWRRALWPVVPSCFHFVIIPLTVDRGIFSSKEMSQIDLLHRWQPITVPRLNSLSS
ncbi:unnamed protein product [Staurois parvus]|uniref:Uncharacterized protein n=1 Tax=Staurois parvus TaxID=386267 RepID=A0ABN9D9T8_9NEOB|nr:unnamed protein product [Staurois parvus]